MQMLKDRIRKEGRILPGHIVKVDGFLNHRVDTELMEAIAKEFKNLLVAGRCISATHLALASVRVVGPAMATGEAAGKAAALSVKHNVQLRDLDVAALQTALREEGVYLRD